MRMKTVTPLSTSASHGSAGRRAKTVMVPVATTTTTLTIRRRGRPFAPSPSTSSNVAAASSSAFSSVSCSSAQSRSRGIRDARCSASAFKNGETTGSRRIFFAQSNSPFGTNRSPRSTTIGVARPFASSPAVAATAAASAASAASPPPSSTADADLVVVGAGASGLAAALAAHRRGQSVLVLEASEDAVGGRVATDVLSTPRGDFLLDRGFQIFLTSYPTARALLDYAQLELKSFYAGAAVRFDDSWSVVADPFRHPLDALATLLPSHPIGSPLDKVKVGLLRAALLARAPRDADAPSLLLPGSSSKIEKTTLEALREDQGFSEEMIDRFFRPFLGGIFFDDALRTSSRLFEFVMRSLATGSNCLPDNGRGIGGVTRQMADALPRGSIRLGARVVGVEGRGGIAGGGGNSTNFASAILADGTRMRARLGVVVATERDAAEELLGSSSPLLTVAPSKQGPPVGTACLYFDAPSAPLAGAPMLMLNGELGKSRRKWKGATVNNATCLSSVAPSYAPRGRHLVSVSTVGVASDYEDEASLVEAVREQLDEWCGQRSKMSSLSSSSSNSSSSPLSAANAVDVAEWEHLRTYRIPHAQPPQSPPTDFAREVSLGKGLFVAGDHRGAATLEGAMAVGVRAADEAARRGGE